jgi:hypothetical protein
MSHWEKLSREHPQLKSLIQPGLEWAYKYCAQMDLTKGDGQAINLICNKLEFLMIVYEVLNLAICMSWIKNQWYDEYIKDAETKIHEMVKKGLLY